MMTINFNNTSWISLTEIEIEALIAFWGLALTRAIDKNESQNIIIRINELNDVWKGYS